MRINGETRAGEVGCCHWVRSSHTLFPPKERNPLLLCAEGAPSSKTSAPLPLKYRLPPFRSALLLGSPPFGALFLGCHPIVVSSFWGAILLRSNPFWMLCFGVLSVWGAILLGAIPLRCYPFGVHPLEYHLFCTDWVFPKGSAGVQCYNGNILFYTVTPVYNVYCPPPMSQLHLS